MRQEKVCYLLGFYKDSSNRPLSCLGCASTTWSTASILCYNTSTRQFSNAQLLFLATPHMLLDLRSLTKDWTQAVSCESAEFYPLAHQGITCFFLGFDFAHLGESTRTHKFTKANSSPFLHSPLFRGPHFQFFWPTFIFLSENLYCLILSLKF